MPEYKLGPSDSSITSLISSTQVDQGGRRSVYQVFPFEPLNKFPSAYNGVLEVALQQINTLQGWKPEAYLPFTKPGGLFTYFSMAIHTKSSQTPMTTRIFGEQGINLERVLNPCLVAQRLIHPTGLKDTVFDYRKAYYVDLSTVQPPVSDLLYLTRPPIINRVIVSHFHYFQQTKDDSPPKAITDDPWRFLLTVVGIPEEILKVGKEGLERLREGGIKGLENAQPMDLVLTIAAFDGYLGDLKQLRPNLYVIPSNWICLYDSVEKDWVHRPISVPQKKVSLAQRLRELAARR